jgi:ABC-type Fe3+-hydroxamate transport system substrate-binding protein
MDGKKEKFKLLAEKRVNNAIKQLELVGNLSNKNAYSYDDAEVKKIINTLKAEVKRVENRFEDAVKGLRNFKL